MRKPKQTVAELMNTIKADAASLMPWPLTAQVTIWPSGQTWRANFHSIDPVKDESFGKHVAAVVSFVQTKFDLEPVRLEVVAEPPLPNMYAPKQAELVGSAPESQSDNTFPYVAAKYSSKI